VAEQAAVLVGTVLLMLRVQGAPLAEDGQAEEDEQTDGPSVHELSLSLHAYSIICEMPVEIGRLQVFGGKPGQHTDTEKAKSWAMTGTNVP